MHITGTHRTETIRTRGLQFLQRLIKYGKEIKPKIKGDLGFWGGGKQVWKRV